MPINSNGIFLAFSKIEKSFDKLGEAFNKLFSALGPEAANADIIDGIANAIIFLIEAIAFIAEPIAGMIYILALGANAAAELISGLNKLYHIFKLIDEILTKKSLVPSFDALYKIMLIVDNTIQQIISTFRNIGNITEIQQLANAFTNITTPIQQLIDLIDGAFTTAIDGFKKLVQDIIDMIPEIEVPEPPPAVQKAASGDIGGAITEGLNTLVSLLPIGHSGGTFTSSVDSSTRKLYDQFGLSNDEGLAILQNGEIILSRDMLNNMNQLRNLSFVSQRSAKDELTEYLETNRSASNKQNSNGPQVVNEENKIEVNIDMKNSNFQSESVANDVEQNIVRSMRNKQGSMYKQINDNYGKSSTMNGIRRR